MTDRIRTVSPVDGSLYADHPVTSEAEIAAALAAASAAQRAWRHTPVAQRAQLCIAAVAAMLAMEAEIVPELAWQMGQGCLLGCSTICG